MIRHPVVRFLLAALVAAPMSSAALAATQDETIPLTLADGRDVTATIRRPLEVEGRLPALMVFGGFQRAAQVLDRVKLERPVIWATFDYPFAPPRKFRFPESLGYAPEMRAAIHGSFDGVGKLYQALAKRSDVDPARITVVGASAGAPFATVGAAKSGIPGVVLVQGFSDVEAVVTNLLTRKYRARYGDWIQGPARLLAKWILWYCEVPDIAAYARALTAQQKVLLIAAAKDEFIPKRASDELWAALQESKSKHERIELSGGHLGIGDDSALLAEILRRAVAWMEQRGLL